ncbi:ExbD/TolR family protein [Primorskyibacter marinus]|uniref:ExbD/TolR family protein n=1 Tax=Primorskyibacter marinus TaxID=1977320 RepID=UPI000E305DC8|nr:biopolymer transporter ExbD [Primorskyibacter marinus]
MTRLLPPIPRRAAREPVVPMINVVFLLLIFFLMTASLTPPDPLPLTLPQSASEAAADQANTLYLASDGRIAFGTLRGAEAETAAATGASVLLKADRDAPAQALAALLTRLTRLGAQQVSVVTEAAP